jgi:DNA ligase-associated metallophosphoesterase
MLDFSFGPATLCALGSGALFVPRENLLCVSDLHLGKSERMARRGGALLPPYETLATLDRLDTDLTRTGARAVICLGDSFDDLAAAGALDETCRLWLTRLMAGRDWTWVEGNHDPGPLELGGTHRAEVTRAGLVFRHEGGGSGFEVSGHYHPKASLPGRGARPCFLIGAQRLILPAYGTYTGGLRAEDPLFDPLIGPGARAIVTGAKPLMIPRPQRP